ncbi:hypothetical protein ACFQZX_07755 [Mucilaginibacter litoreus]|uniref:Signal peptidase n=1 Tax=Mucilaginibacter litoreus TaxID=1048221 RepID=A0ABW3ARM3_9SPHI
MIKRIFLFLIIFILNAAVVLADDPPFENPCEGHDIDDPTPCELPLDTWVYVLVFAAIIFGAYKLYQKNKAVTAIQ